MSIPMLTRDEFLKLREYIKCHCGVDLTDSKDYLVEGRLRCLVAETGCQNFGDFCLHLQANPTSELREKIIDAITTNETLWFRDASCWDTLRHLFNNQLLRPGRRRLSIWSAACATGQEPYSLAMELSELKKQKPHWFHKLETEILATDISSAALARARLARYDRISMSRGLPDHFRDQYFTPTDNVWTLKDEIKQQVTFRKFNLQDSFTSLGRFDLILMRNVLIYFSSELKTEIFKKIKASLIPGGFLIIGAAESVSPVSQEFEMKEFGRGVCYQVKPDGNGLIS